MISQVKLIAEPWDLGEGGYQVGNFPLLWTEWNGKYRDCVRRFWKGDGGTVSEFATRLCGSSDLYEWSGRRPHASINFVTCHDGFTLHDLVSYNDKHNEANGEDNRDGESTTSAGTAASRAPPTIPPIRALREAAEAQLPDDAAVFPGRADDPWRATKSATPSRATTTPIARTTKSPGSTGISARSRKACCSSSAASRPFSSSNRSFTAAASSTEKPSTGRRPRKSPGSSPSGKQMSDQPWNEPSCVLRRGWFGKGIDTDQRGEQIDGDTILLLFNADHHNAIDFHLPPTERGLPWELLIDTFRDNKPTRRGPSRERSN